MKTRRPLLVGAVLLVALARAAPPARTSLPEQLGDPQFWRLSERLSESGGTFRSENLLSNERELQVVIPELQRAVPPGRVYIGVGPEQNFTYIAALRPALAFIVDIRRRNLHLHLMYKALFELSADRVEFAARLFSRPRPAGLSAAAPVEDILHAVAAASSPPDLLEANLRDIRHHLTRTRRLPLEAEDLEGIAWIARAFQRDGPGIQYSVHFGRVASFPTYAELMTATDGAGTARSFLATPQAFAFLQSLHARNLIVPVVGDFAGPAALRSLGRYLRDHQALVGAFYLSNVEQYLGREGRWHLFCENVATLPLDPASTFIRSIVGRHHGLGLGLSLVSASILAETRGCRRY
jgi:hypothetical protein